MADQLRPVIDPALERLVRIAAARAGFGSPSPYINEVLAHEFSCSKEKRHVPLGEEDEGEPPFPIIKIGLSAVTMAKP